MKTTIPHSRRGSALVTVLMLTMALTIVIASTIGYSLTERRLNHRSAMRLEARNAAEAISEYGMSQIRELMNKRRDYTSTRFTTGADADSVAALPTSFWGASQVVTTGANAPELIIGLQTKVPAEGLFFYDPNDPANEFDPLKGRYAFRFDLRVISKATVSPTGTAAGGPQTAYMSQTLSARAAPLFSHAIFYNMDLEIWPGPAMNILGGVHTNGNFYVKKQSTNNTALNFQGPVSIAGGGHPPGDPSGFYSGVKVNIRNTNGTSDDLSTYTDNTFFRTPAGGLSGIKDTSVNPNRWRDHKWGENTETPQTQEKFRMWATQTFGGNLQTNLHGVQVSVLPGIGTYQEDDTPTNGVDNSINTARRLIETPLRSTDTYPDNGVAYSAEIEAQKYSTQAGIYIVANPTSVARQGRKPDGSLVWVAARKYRVFTKSGTELILPGQVDWGQNPANTIGNFNSNLGTNTALLGGQPIVTIRPNAMTDLRRGRRSNGTAFNWGANRAAANAYNPLEIDTIDIDMRALKLAVDRTVNGLAQSTVYRTVVPADGTATNNVAWTRFIYNPSATPEAIALGNQHKIQTPNPLLPLLPPVDWNGADWNGAIYIESIAAEARSNSTVRDDASGVRLNNGRGRLASDGTEGLTIATNDAVYILGHYNADGTIHTASNNSSGRYNEDGETPCSIVGDALTILSTPRYVNTGSRIGQDMGWNDATSRHRNTTSNYNSSWMTSNPANTNRQEGIDTTVSLYRLPYSKNNSIPFDDGAAVQYLHSNYNTNTKGAGNHTEISAAFLVGIVISNKDGNGQNSGGANNYPRFNEDFSASGSQTTIAIRGSIVAMFESRVATEPWNWRTFNAPTRLWGFNELFNEGKFPPLTPITMYYRRIDFNDISGTEYNALKTSWGL